MVSILQFSMFPYSMLTPSIKGMNKPSGKNSIFSGKFEFKISSKKWHFPL